MPCLFKQKAKAQAFLILGAFPVAGTTAILLIALIRAADASSPYFWIGMAVVAGYASIVRSKWDQIQRGDFFSWGLSPEANGMRGHYQRPAVDFLTFSAHSDCIVR